ncbi:hypothetical protein A9179_16395 [Pseudomonas alcaligenes]|uniref:Conjugal transfer protein TraD n=1 Tax=Aquipseudomonas alcaligenes TaxID=43263 RepID=A0ABR7S5G8_AQUAC|nr:hypothetical protein [Pseudomonas alcaligenes]MBC9251851.1 hypothetical protein [Pseudomonas alcaligenes]
MSDPLKRATAKPPPTVGEGCLSRYDLEALQPEDGTEFAGAAELWEQLRQEQDAPAEETEAQARPARQ